tara:strand:+ start:1737 stop:1964 length:228 start_codon:yes stop_codon:yes gene_type:complete
MKYLDEVELASFLWDHPMKNKMSPEDADWLDSRCLDEDGSFSVEDFDDQKDLDRVKKIADELQLSYIFEEPLSGD